MEQNFVIHNNEGEDEKIEVQFEFEEVPMSYSQSFDFDTFEKRETKTLTLEKWLYEAADVLVKSFLLETPGARLAQLWDHTLQRHPQMSDTIAELLKEELQAQAHLQKLIENSEENRATELMISKKNAFEQAKKVCDAIVDMTIFYTDSIRNISNQCLQNLKIYRNLSRELEDLHTKIKTSDLYVPKSWRESIESVLDEEYERHKRLNQNVIASPEETHIRMFDRAIPEVRGTDVAPIDNICKLRIEVMTLKAQLKMIDELLFARELLYVSQ